MAGYSSVAEWPPTTLVPMPSSSAVACADAASVLAANAATKRAAVRSVRRLILSWDTRVLSREQESRSGLTDLSGLPQGWGRDLPNEDQEHVDGHGFASDPGEDA